MTVCLDSTLKRNRALTGRSCTRRSIFSASVWTCPKCMGSDHLKSECALAALEPTPQYRYTNDLLSLEAAVPHDVSLPDIILCGYVSTPLNHAMWSLLLSEYSDRQFVGYVVRGLHRGFLVAWMPIFSSEAVVSLEQYTFCHLSSGCY